MSTKSQKIGVMVKGAKQRAELQSKKIKSVSKDIIEDPLGLFGIVILSIMVFLGAFGPQLAPYEPLTSVRAPDGTVERLSGPSLNHPMGTTQYGRDVFSQVILGARVSLIVGFTASVMAVFIGTNVGLLSGYFGGVIESVLMRITDIAYGLPFLPFVIVFVVVMGPSLSTIIMAIVIIQWRATARVIRSQVLTHKERPYVEAARASGAGNVRIMYMHILPNVLPLAFLYGAFAVAWAIIMEANASFLGFGDPDRISWGTMIFEAYNADVLHIAWWWVLPPGIMIMLFVMAVFFIARAIEESIHPSLRHRGQ